MRAAAWVFLAAGLGSLGGCAKDRDLVAAAIEAPRAAVLPATEERPDLFIVKARTGRGAVLRLLVDTAAKVTVISPKAVGRAGLDDFTLRPPHRVHSSEGTTREVSRGVHVEALSLGAVTLRGLEALEVRLGGLPFSIDGILGWDVLSRLRVLFDPARRQVHLLPSEPASDQGIAAYLDAQPDLPEKWQRLKVTADGFGPSFGFEFSDGTRVPMFIDTGAAQTSFPEDVLVRIGDQAGVKPLGTTTAVGVHGKPHRAPRYHMDRLDIGTYHLSLSVSGVPRNFALLGMDVLSRFYFLVDGPGRELWFALRTDG